MNSTKENALIKNTEGAILIQLLLQVMRGTDACNEVCEPLLNLVKTRMQRQPLNSLLKKHMIGIYLSAVLYNRQAAMAYFEQQQMTCSLVQEMINLTKHFRHAYERKMFIVGISEMLQNEQLPEGLRPLLFSLITELINMMLALAEQEEKELKKRARADIDPDDSSSQEDSDDLLDDDIEDIDNENDGSDDSDEAVDGDKVIKDNDLGFAKEERKGNFIDSDDDDDNVYGSEDDNAAEYMFDINVVMDIVDSPLKQADPRLKFCDALRSLSQKSPTDL